MDHATVSLIGGVGLLERAIAYTLGSLQLVTPDALARASPCRGWDLSALLRHLNDSLEVMHEAVDVGHVDLAPTGADDEGRADFDGHGDRDASPAATLRDRA